MFYFDDGKSITVFFKSGESAVWQTSNPNYAVVKDLAEKSEWIAIETLNNASKAVIEGTEELKDDKVVAHTEDVTLTVELPKENKFVKFVQLLKDKGANTDSIKSTESEDKNRYKLFDNYDYPEIKVISDEDEALKRLLPMKLKDQYTFKNSSVLETLKFRRRVFV